MKEIITHTVRRFYPYQPLLWIRGKLIIRKQNDNPSAEEISCYYWSPLLQEMGGMEDRVSLCWTERGQKSEPEASAQKELETPDSMCMCIVFLGDNSILNYL